ncbi:unnamed protein product [Paramecium octaurelia]|uniref:Uncharacterized protein n=1 Tax=Paramecium octaurelia TaxID=43137 RepID=A0A8S1TXV4_PAROT|nr:unnamed protein product [Paramecium octaurelia]
MPNFPMSKIQLEILHQTMVLRPGIQGRGLMLKTEEEYSKNNNNKKYLIKQQCASNQQIQKLSICQLELIFLEKFEKPKNFDKLQLIKAQRTYSLKPFLEKGVNCWENKSKLFSLLQKQTQVVQRNGIIDGAYQY